MKAQFIGCTLVVTPETDKERQELKYHGSGNRLWECWGWEENEDSFSVQGLCPVGLQDTEILGYLRFMLEMDEQPDTEDPAEIQKQNQAAVITMDKIRDVLNDAS